MHKEQFPETAWSVLRKDGARMTRARRLIIETLAEARAPLTAKDIFETVSAEVGTAGVDLASVYRTIERLENLGLVHSVPPHGVVACRHVRCHNQRHVLLRCRDCTRIEEWDVPNQVLEPLFGFLATGPDFTPDRHVLRVDGQCEDCRGA